MEELVNPYTQGSSVHCDTLVLLCIALHFLQMGAESDETEYYPDLSPSPSDEEDRMPALMEVSQQKEEEVSWEGELEHDQNLTCTSRHNIKCGHPERTTI